MRDASPAPAAFPESAPQRLRARVESLLAAAGAGDANAPETLLVIARRTIERVLEAGSGDREAALDVLSADALVTHLLDVLASHPDDFEVRCDEVLRHLAEIAPAP